MPGREWNALDPAAIATARGDTAILLNGPRHWLMDEASGKTGPTAVFDGLRFRQVATIPIRTPQELAQAPYAEHTIVRRNTWRWNHGRTVYELHAPGGAIYVMQSYSQIKDPTETVADLPALGARLMLPAGWTLHGAEAAPRSGPRRPRSRDRRPGRAAQHISARTVGAALNEHPHRRRTGVLLTAAGREKCSLPASSVHARRQRPVWLRSRTRM